MELEVNYPKEVKHFDMSKRPRKQALWTFPVLPMIRASALGKRKQTIIKDESMKGLKPPYLVIANHSQFLDIPMMSKALKNHHAAFVTVLNGYNTNPWLFRQLGCIPKRVFTPSISLPKQINTCLHKDKSVVVIFPEAHYSRIGTTGALPGSIFNLFKFLKVPVVVANLEGFYQECPSWCEGKSRKGVELKITLKKVFSVEELLKLSQEEIKNTFMKAFAYNAYDYQLKNNILINEPFRAEGLERVLYKCPECGAEFKMSSQSCSLKCENCNAVWESLPNGQLKAASGKLTKFSSPPDWYEWQRAEVVKEIEKGSYSYTETVDVFSLPNPPKFISLGNAALVHNLNGISLTGNFNNREWCVTKAPKEMPGIQQEFSFPFLHGKDVLGISTVNDTFFWEPSDPRTAVKLCLATEELYRQATTQKQGNSKQNNQSNQTGELKKVEQTQTAAVPV